MLERRKYLHVLCYCVQFMCGSALALGSELRSCASKVHLHLSARGQTNILKSTLDHLAICCHHNWYKK